MRAGEPLASEPVRRPIVHHSEIIFPLSCDSDKNKGPAQLELRGQESLEQRTIPLMYDDSTKTASGKVNNDNQTISPYERLHQAASLPEKAAALLATFDAIAGIGCLPVSLGPDNKGGIKKPTGGADWGLQPLDVRRRTFVKAVDSAARNGTLDAIGIGLQPRGRLLVIDVDPPGKDRTKLDESLAELAELSGGECPLTFQVDGQGGCHLWFTVSDQLLSRWAKATRGKTVIRLVCGGNLELFMPMEDTQYQVATAPSAGKTIACHVDPAPLPEPFEATLLAMFCQANKKATPSAPFIGNADQSWTVREKCFHAIVGQCDKAIRAAPQGGRHNTIRDRSLLLAGYASGMGYAGKQAECTSVLIEAGIAVGASEREARRIVSFGWVNGIEKPLIPSDPVYLKIEKDFADRAAKLANSQAELKSRITEAVTKNADGEIEFFEGREPDHGVDLATCDFSTQGLMNMLNQDSATVFRHLAEGYLESSQCMLVGAMGAGKGCFGPMLANHITNGADWWTGRKCKPGSVVIVSPEDNSETIKMRCRFAGARVHGDIVDGVEITDGPRVLCMGSGSRPIMWPNGDQRSIGETAFLDLLVKATGDLRLIVIDPIKSFMGKRGPSESEEDHVRRVLTISLNWANKNGVAILLIIHPSKGAGVRNVNDQASGSHAWTAVTRSVVAIEKNPNYGPSARALIAGRQSNAQEGLTAIFDLEVGDAKDKSGERVPVTDTDGIVELNPDGTIRRVSTVRLAYRESLPVDHEYELPSFDREGSSKGKAAKLTGRKVVDTTAIRLAACLLVSSQPDGRMSSFPDDELLQQMGPVATDDRWLHFACGHLAREFSCSPSTALNKVRPVFKKTDQEPVPGFVTRPARVGFGRDGQWFWESHPEQRQSSESDTAF
jgi:hypothetical protein